MRHATFFVRAGSLRGKMKAETEKTTDESELIDVVLDDVCLRPTIQCQLLGLFATL